MTTATEVAADVMAALKTRGFVLSGRATDGWYKLCGALKTAADTQACELELDPQFSALPRIRLLGLPESLPPVNPHLGSGGSLCYVAKGTVVLDIFDPVGQTLACVKRAEEVFEKVLRGEMVEDLEDEFFAYWGGSLCLVDIQGGRLGRQDCLVFRTEEGLNAVVTDDVNRSTKKLKALGWDVVDHTVLTYRVRTGAKPKPLTRKWPPETVGDVLSWQAMLDARCRRKIEQRLKSGMKSGARGALVLVESPLLTYAFAVPFDHGPTGNGSTRGSRTPLYMLKAVPMSVVRIDDRYIAERNVPGMRTLAGKRLVVVGCGTIGGYLADMLIRAGAGTSGGQLTLVDFELLHPQNIGRHRLGFPSLFANKARGLADELKRLAPGANIRALPVNVQQAHLGIADLIIDATGEEALGHWLCKRYLADVPMLSAWIEGPGIAVRALLRATSDGACYRCLCDANRHGLFETIVGEMPTLLAGQGCEGMYVPFPATVSVQAASLAADMALAWANGIVSPSLRTRLLDPTFQLATPDCSPPRTDGCPACPS